MNGLCKIHHRIPGDLAILNTFLSSLSGPKSRRATAGQWAVGTMECQFPKTGPGLRFYRGQELERPPSFLEYGVLDNEVEEEMADTIPANWAAGVLGRKHDRPFFLGFGLYAPHRANYVERMEQSGVPG